MPSPKTFSVLEAANEPYDLDVNHADRVILYRFGNRTMDWDWLSRKRQANGGAFATPPGTLLNEWALKQSSFGSNSEGIQDNPYLSMATSYQRLFDQGEGWVQDILRSVPHLGVFSVPFRYVHRPRPTKSISKMETEWLYYDGDEELLGYLVEWRDNPYRQANVA
ncbi:MAG: hypothetical protein H6712_27430 [Myxococcales bacterium]|nr:hypothetical protein [Myxococcales bacterium]MCB9717610.1 hypothetical protein [Myxococcales bacterium]